MKLKFEKDIPIPPRNRKAATYTADDIKPMKLNYSFARNVPKAKAQAEAQKIRKVFDELGYECAFRWVGGKLRCWRTA